MDQLLSGIVDKKSSLEWDSLVNRLCNRGGTSQYLELARIDILFRFRPFLQELLKKTGEALRGN